MRTGGRAAVAVALPILAFGLFLVGVAARLVDPPPVEHLVVEIPFFAASLVYAAVGVVIVVRSSAHRVGWVFYAAGLTVLISAAMDLVSEGSVVLHTARDGFFPLVFVFAGFVMLWFPSGRPPTPSWRWLEWVGYSAGVSNFVGTVFAGQLCTLTAGGRCLRFFENPIGLSWIPNADYGAFASVVKPLLVGFILASAGSLVVRFVRSRGVERKQLAWFAYATTALIVTAVVNGLWLTENSFAEAVGTGVLGLLGLALPVAAAVAILRYRLYEIDRIVSRTAGYAVLIAVLALLYTAGAVWLPSRLLGDESPPLFVAASTLAVAALFNPLRRRVMWWMDRRFYRSRYDAAQVAESLSLRLRDQTEVGQLTADWVWAVRRTVQPVAVGLWVRP